MSAPDTWSYHHPTALHFGPECWRGAGLGSRARRVLLLTSPGLVRRGTAERVRVGWGGAAEIVVCARLSPHPELAALTALARELQGESCDGVIALGGGSVMDTAKVLTALLAPGAPSLAELLRADAPPPPGAWLPLDTVPTTAGSGSEVTPFATVWERALGKKHSLSSPRLFPRRTFLDPDLTRDVPADLAISTGLDALSQGLESIWNVRANPLSSGFARRAVEVALSTLPALVGAGPLAAADRSALMFASLSGGLAISQTRTALAHSMSYPLTAYYGLPHGLACSFSLPAVLAYNQGADDGRLAQLARACVGGTVEDLRTRLIELLVALQVDERLRRHGVGGEQLERVVPEMIHPGRADNNLRAATPDGVRDLLRTVGDYLPGCRFPSDRHA